MTYLAVFAGGALGALARELLTVHAPLPGPTTSTLLANVLACLALGWLHAARHRVHAHATHFGAVGFCGGLSTFSAFVADVAGLAHGVGTGVAALATALELAVGLLAAGAGLALGRALHGSAPRRGRSG